MNSIEYKNIFAFHPGYYIAEVIEDMEISQEEFATRMGTTAKTISKLVNGQINLSKDLAAKLAAMLGTGVDVWLNLQKTYDQKILELEHQKQIDEQIEIVKVIDYAYFVKIAHLQKTRKAEEKVANLCGYLKIYDLHLLLQPDFLVNFRTGISNVQEKNIINARVWLQTAINCSMNKNIAAFNSETLKGYLPEIRGMTVQKPESFLPRLRDIFAECGVSFVLLPHLSNSGINGAVRWMGPEKVILAMNDRRSYADTFWFSLFHEIKHVLQQKVKTTFVSCDAKNAGHGDTELEAEADKFAREYLIPATEYNRFTEKSCFSDNDIEAFASNIGIHAGIVAGRLQHDGFIEQNRCSRLKERYRIIISPCS